MITIAQILKEMWPDSFWSIDGDDYNTLRWYSSNKLKKPTLEQIEASRVQAEVLIEWKKIRQRRNRLLQESDWTQVKDSPLSSEQSEIWATYRQDLRDLPQVFDDPDFVIWPDQPE